MMDWLRKVMYGRYGVDQLSVGLLILSILLSFLTLPFHSVILRILTLLPIVICYLRTFSRQISKRQQENFKFLRYYNPAKNKVLKWVNRLKDRKTHRYFKCPKCKQQLRVPKGKGNIAITCPKCKEVFHKRS